MSEGTKIPLADALVIAQLIKDKLSPYCIECEIAGSVRREKDFVSDIELVMVPWTQTTTQTIKVDLFAPQSQTVTRRLQGFQDGVMSLGDILQGDINNGRYVKLKHESGIKIDLFITTESDYGRQVAIRTGSSDYSMKVIATGWVKKGWVGTPDGLRVRTECVQKGSTWNCTAGEPTLPPPFHTEQDFFKFIGVPWIEPKYRNL